MKYGFNVFQTEVNDHVFWVAESKDLKGCVAQGDTIEEALKELEQNEIDWLETAKECDISIPENKIVKEVEYSGKFSVRMAKSVHREAVENAEREGISLNQYVNNAIIKANCLHYTKALIEEELKGTLGVINSTYDEGFKRFASVAYTMGVTSEKFNVKPVYGYRF